jgi:hypothetical protein
MARKSSPELPSHTRPADVSSSITAAPLEEKKIVFQYDEQKKRKSVVKREKRKPMSPLHALCEWLVDHQIGIYTELRD